MNEVRLGRNFLRVGDRIHVKPSQPGKQDGFDSRVKALREESVGIVVDLFDRKGAFRTLTLDKIERKIQTKKGERL